jgi:hypothetical protein
VVRSEQAELVRALLDRHGQTFAAELGIDVANNTPSPLFRLLCAAALMSTRNATPISVEASRTFLAHGWRTAAKLFESTWEERVRALGEAGHTRDRERTATMLGDMVDLLCQRYGGDLRRLRDEAGRDPEAERRLLKDFKGLGDEGVDIFFREVQVAWPELAPFADRRARDAAGRLGLPAAADGLAALVAAPDLPRLVTALVRVDVAEDYEGVRAAADGGRAVWAATPGT